MISKVYLYHLVSVKDSNLETSPLQSVLVVYKFPEAFLDDLFRVLPDME